MESLNGIKETTDVSPLVFAPITINLYPQVVAFHSLQNKVELFHTLLNLMRADTSLNITIRVLLLFMPSTAWVKSGTIDWQSAHVTVQRSPLAFQSPLPIIWYLIQMPILCLCGESRNMLVWEEQLPHKICIHFSSWMSCFIKSKPNYLKSWVQHLSRWPRIYFLQHTGTFLSPPAALCESSLLHSLFQPDPETRKKKRKEHHIWI